MDKNANFRLNLVIFGQKILFSLENSKVLIPTYRKPTQAPCSHWFLVRYWTKCAKNGNIWPKMTKNADFGPNLVVFGPKILIITVFCYPHNRKPTYAHCLLYILVGHRMKWAKNTNIWPKMTKNAYFGTNLAVFGPKILIFAGVSKSFGT